MQSGTIIFIIILYIAAIPVGILELTLLTPFTRGMLPPVFSISALIAISAFVGMAGSYLHIYDNKPVDGDTDGITYHLPQDGNI